MKLFPRRRNETTSDTTSTTLARSRMSRMASSRMRPICAPLCRLPLARVRRCEVASELDDVGGKLGERAAESRAGDPLGESRRGRGALDQDQSEAEYGGTLGDPEGEPGGS